MDVAIFKQKPILGILRGAQENQIEPLVETVIDAGLETLEITMNTPGAAQLIQKAKQISAGRLTLGAGTVLNLKDLKIALKSGATFIVMPVLVRDVVKYCVKHKIPVFPVHLLRKRFINLGRLALRWLKFFRPNFLVQNIFAKSKAHLITLSF